MRRNNAARKLIDQALCIPGETLAALLNARRACAEWLPFYFHLEKCSLCFQKLMEVRRQRDQHLFRKTSPVEEDQWVEEQDQWAEPD